MRTDSPYMRPQRGFSLIEVLVAVVILSTGLLALAALQGSLTKASADAKVRSQVASLLQGRMDQLRTVGYASAATMTDSCATNAGATNGSDFVTQAFCTQNGLGAMTVTQTVTTWTGAVGGATFAIGAPASADAPQFKRVVLSAAWTDATGATNRRLAVASDLSELGLKDTIVPPPEDSNVGGQQPIVRQASPATAGVIPIAMGGNDATAATNPRPEVMGRNNNQSVVGTTFNVLTYTNESTPFTGVRIQRRIENNLIHCNCQYGAAGANFANLPEIYRRPSWPAVWTGDGYETFKPNPAAPAPGTTYRSAPVGNEPQSPLCTECCRDHHDTAITGAGKFDSERTDGVGKYGEDNQGNLTASPVNTNNGVYVNACRIIRVDGFWRTAQDTYARHFGLLATQTVGTKVAGNGIPATNAATAYQVFVKDFLGGYSGTATPSAATASTMFNDPGRGLNNPTDISINRPAPKDERYLHGRGLYVDFLEQKARDKLAYEINNCTLTPAVNCILPYLPFTTINVTELAFWKATNVGTPGTPNNSVIAVATGGSLFYDPALPTRGRTNALSTTTNGLRADATAELSPSNAGLAIVSPGIDPQDSVPRVDAQSFTVAASGGAGTGGNFSVNLIGLPQTSDTNTSNDPSVAWSISSQNGNCNATIGGNDRDPNSYACNTTVTLGVTGAVQISNYFREFDVTKSITAQCTSSSGTVTVTESTPVPTFANYQVTTVTGLIGGPVIVSNDARRSETSTVTFGSIPNGAVINFNFGLQGNIEATIQSCTATRANANKPWTFGTIVWNRPWIP